VAGIAEKARKADAADAARQPAAGLRFLDGLLDRAGYAC
jgi:hypothetical protein